MTARAPHPTVPLFRRVAPAAAPSEPLTLREQEVLQLMSQGAANRQIARSLDISENTVKTHVRHILDKLNLESRSQLVGYLHRADPH